MGWLSSHSDLPSETNSLGELGIAWWKRSPRDGGEFAMRITKEEVQLLIAAIPEERLQTDGVLNHLVERLIDDLYEKEN